MEFVSEERRIGNTAHMVIRSATASVTNIGFLLLGALLAIACSGSSSGGNSEGNPGVGGDTATGGAAANTTSGGSSGTSGGAMPTGGALGTGGTGTTQGAGGATGGASATAATGGTSVAAGGSKATGGTSAAAGGSNLTGGTSAVAGGSKATGGTSAAAGGSNLTGGTSTNGGSSAAGGKVGTGGTSAVAGGSNLTGGTSSTSSSTATGGKVSTGGTNGTGGTGNTAGTSSTSGLPQLHVDGNLVKDPNGKTIILRGVSLIDIGNLYYAGQQSAAGITARIDKILAAGLLPHVMRLPVYPRTCVNGNSPAYSQVPYPIGPAAPTGIHIAVTPDQYLSNVLKPAVDYATQKGMYVIIDFHQIDNATTGTSAADATTFWQFMAAKFANYTNVLYEPFNEPIDSAVTWANFKSVAQGWVDTIRADAPNNIIIVPSMSYAQKPGDAADSPLTGTNLMYTAHIYPGNWSTAFKAQVANAVTKVPVFMTEWGYVLNGTDRTLGTSVATWGTDFRTLVDSEGASWTAWVTDNGWQPNMFSNTALTTLTDFGNVTKTWLSDTATSDWVQ